MEKELNIKEVINLSEKDYNALDTEDKEILDDIYSKGSWVSMKNENPKKFEEMKARFSKATIWWAKRAKKAISLRVNEEDVLAIKKIAEKEGLPYQTFISSILHKVATEQIKI